MTPTPRIQRYVDELLSRWPDINTDEGQDSPWADGPLIGNASGPDDLLRDGHEQSCRCSRRNRRTGHRWRTGVLRPPKLPPCSDRSGGRAPSWPNCCSRQRTGDITAPGALLFPESRAVIEERTARTYEWTAAHTANSRGDQCRQDRLRRRRHRRVRRGPGGRGVRLPMRSAHHVDDTATCSLVSRSRCRITARCCAAARWGVRAPAPARARTRHHRNLRRHSLTRVARFLMPSDSNKLALAPCGVRLGNRRE